MLPHIDKWLDKWVEWSVRSNENIGYSTTTPEYRMMTTNAATTSKAKHRSKIHLIVVGGNKVRRDIDPQRCKETKTFNNPSWIDQENSEAGELMERAVNQLRSEQLKAIKLKYMESKSNEEASSILHMSRANFSNLVNIAHESIDTYLRTVSPIFYRKYVHQLND